MKVIKITTFVVLLASITSIIWGLTVELEYSKKLVGFGVIGLVFIVFPLFSYYRWKDKSLKDYMLTKENFDKMRENQKR
jgi:hypothetical protein